MTQMMIKSPSVAVPPNPDLVFKFTTTAINTSIVLPTAQYAAGTTTPMVYNCIVDWGDGEPTDNITVWNQAERTHVYALVGTYIVTISGVFERINFTDNTTQKALVEIMNWGSSQYKDFFEAFYFCNFVFLTALDAPDLSQCTNLSKAFYSSDNISGDFTGWNVSTITNMNRTFYHCELAGSDFKGWDVSNVTDMGGIFSNTTGQFDVSDWITSSVINFQVAFDSSEFNGDLSGWDVSSATEMDYMFSNCAFNNNSISAWTINPVGPVNMFSMFYLNLTFNQPLDAWDMSAVTNIRGMFQATQAFNQDLNSWDVSNCTSFDSVFWYALAFDGNISAWTTSQVTTFYGVLRATQFTGDISGWDFTGINNTSGGRYMLSNITWSTAMYDAMIQRLYDQRAGLYVGCLYDVNSVNYTIATQGANMAVLENVPYQQQLQDAGGI